MAKTYHNVKEMVKGLSGNKKLKEDVLHEISSKTLSKYLFSLRCENGLTQAELAKKIGCTQGKISKLENSYDTEITVNDLIAYGNALGLQPEIGYRRRNIKTVDLIKHHCFKVNDYLEELRKLAEKDEIIKEGVFDFHIETVCNVVKMVLDGALKIDIQENVKKVKEPIHISPPAQDILSITKETTEEKITIKE